MLSPMKPSHMESNENTLKLLEWRDLIRNPHFAGEVVLTTVILAGSVWFCMAITHYVHARPGVILDDPIHNLIGPINLRWPVFVVLWSSLVAGICILSKAPERLLIWLQAAAALICLRGAALYLVPLAPPQTIIPLADPIATLRTEAGDVIANDLFFSGHTATMFLLFLAIDSIRVRLFVFAGFVFIGVAVVLQHVHYCGDVFAAPFFAYGSWRLVLFIHKKVEKSFSY